MNFTVTVSGDITFEAGDLIMDAVENRKGNVYSRLTQDIQLAIQRNADASYDSSEAKQIAIESCHNWQHQDGLHRLDIMAPLFANYRQYGCGNLPITVLVDMTESDLFIAESHLLQEVGNVL